MSVKFKANSTQKSVLKPSDVEPVATNFTANAGPKLAAAEAYVIKWGPLCMISFIGRVTSQINVGDTIITLPKPTTAIFSFGIFGAGSQYGARATGSRIEAINSIPANEWIRGQIIYPCNW